MRIAMFTSLSVLFLACPSVGFSEECADFITKLDTCSPYKCTFVHPLMGGDMEKSIVEFKDGKCIYVEQMPNGGKMECAYTDSVRKAVVEYYKDTEAATAAGKSQGVKVTMKDGKTETKYTVEGKQIENPLQEALNNGQCVISGYGE